MKRDWIRAYRQHGIKYFALPLVVVLALAAVADQRLDQYLDRRQEDAQLQERLNSAQEILALNDKVRDRQRQLEPAFAAVDGKLFEAEDPHAAGAAMRTQLQQLLQGLYFDDVQLSEPTFEQHGSVARMGVQARFAGVAQQLPRLQQALAQSPRLLTLDMLEVQVVDDTRRGGKQLAIAAHFVGLQQRPRAPIPTSTPQNTPASRPSAPERL